MKPISYLIGILLLLLLGGCQLPGNIVPKAASPPKFPTLSIQTIPQDFKGLTEEEVDARIKKMIRFKDHIDRYVDVVYKDVLHKSYTTHEEWMLMCHPSSYFKEIDIPPKPSIKDDGSMTDNEIIMKLVSRIKELVNSMRRHNEDFRSALIRFNKTCQHPSLLSK